jgi:hypothetical protein
MLEGKAKQDHLKRQVLKNFAAVSFFYTSKG